MTVVYNRWLHLCHPLYTSVSSCEWSRGGLTIWKLGHCPRARGE
ncbi:unnamed protein product [Staurois parvus]|uniref:Uncharacterized protein n=1 Tax=Staurois parvus TaxID=386267 RepID=A0ABN9GQ70_9NEOB|nr:unnamed protein product [Staurois parvus]